MATRKNNFAVIGGQEPGGARPAKFFLDLQPGARGRHEPLEGELGKVLGHAHAEDVEQKRDALKRLSDLLAGSPENREAFGSSEHSVGFIAGALDSADDETGPLVADVVKNLCQHNKNKERLGADERTTSAMIGLLESGGLASRGAMAAALANLCAGGCTANKDRIGGNERAVMGIKRLLWEGDAERRCCAAAAIADLCCAHDENQRRLGEDDQVVANLVRLLEEGDSRGRGQAAWTISQLSQSRENRSRLGCGRCVSALVGLSSTGTAYNVQYALAALTALCVDNAANQELIGAHAHTIPALASVLETGNAGAKQEAARALRNLCLLPANRARVGSHEPTLAGLVNLLTGMKGRLQALDALSALLEDSKASQDCLGGNTRMLNALLRILEDGHEDDQRDASTSIAALWQRGSKGSHQLGISSLLIASCDAAKGQAADVLTRLCLGHPTNQTLLGSDRFIPALVALLPLDGQEATLSQVAAARALGSLVINHEGNRLRVRGTPGAESGLQRLSAMDSGSPAAATLLALGVHSSGVTTQA